MSLAGIVALADRQLPGAGSEALITADAHQFARWLDERYDTRLAIVTVDLAGPTLLAGLQRPDAPPAVFVIGDRADGVTLSPNVVAYVARDDAEALAAAIDAALAVPQLAVGDFSDRDAQRLNSLGREVERIARALADIATASQAETAAAATVEASQVRALIKRRRDRERYFPQDLFSDPAWDMLLDLTAARLERRQVSVSSLCIAAAVPTTTALRWIRNLCELGLFLRAVDPDDLRRGLISLSDEAADRMLAYLGAARGPAG